MVNLMSDAKKYSRTTTGGTMHPNELLACESLFARAGQMRLLAHGGEVIALYHSLDSWPGILIQNLILEIDTELRRRGEIK
jgi:hypothetical protein